MPRVRSNADVTLVVLVYRSIRWLEWCMAGVEGAKTVARYRWLVVANDATDEVVSGLQGMDVKWIDHRNPDPDEFYINRVYRAWNRGVVESPTDLVVMLNSDMWPADGWLDALIEDKKTSSWHVPTSLLVESGHIPSAIPEHVRDFGTNPDDFQAQNFIDYAKPLIERRGAVDGRLYMPILVTRQEFVDCGMYPNGNPAGTTGDKELIRRFAVNGLKHKTVLGSVVYHCQEGEMRWP